MEEIKGYRVIELIGKTEHAKLYRVRKRHSKEILRLKIAREPNPEANSLIAREFHILSKFDSENILKVLDYGSAQNGQAYFTSEFVPGETIYKWFRGYSSEFIDAILQLLNAIVQLHDQGYFHGDLKPEHALYDPELKRVCLIDFGFASLVDDWKAPRGSIGYIAPEVLKGFCVDQRSDLYSLGVMMYEILSGSRTGDGLSSKVGIGSTISLRNIDTKTPVEVREVVQRLVSSEPALRPTVGAIYETLVSCASQERRRKSLPAVSLPRLHFADVGQIVRRLGQPKNLKGKTYIICGDKGHGKTRNINELRFKYLMSKCDLIFYSPIQTRTFLEEISDHAQCDTEFGETKDRVEVFERIVRALKTKTRKSNRFLAILVDDLHELVDVDHAFFRYLGFSMADSRILLIATSKPSAEISKMGFDVVQLKVFTEKQLRELLKRTLVKIVNENVLCDWMYKVSGGNPLFVSELLKYLFHRKLLYYEENQWHLKSEELKTMRYPNSVNEVVLRKIEELDIHCLNILQILALYNNPLEPVIIIEIAGMKALEAVEYLRHQGFIKVAKIGGRLAYMTASKITSEIINRNMTHETKSLNYRQFFGVVKEKFGEAPEYYPILAELAKACKNAEDTIGYSLKAAEGCERRYDYEAGIELLERALEHARDVAPDKVAFWLTKIGTFAQKLGDSAKAGEKYLEALKHTNRKSAKFDLYHQLGITSQQRGNYRKAISYFEEALALATKKDSNYVTAMNNLSYSLMCQGKYSDARRMLEKSMSVAGAMENSKLEAKTLYLIAVLEWYLRDYDDAVETAGKALKLARTNRDVASDAQCMILLGSLYQQKGDFEEAEKAYDAAIQSLHTIKDTNALVSAMVNQALIIERLNRIVRATQLLETALNYSRRLGNTSMTASILVNLANIYERKCDFSKAISLNQQAKEMDDNAVKPLFNLSMLYYKQGSIAAAEIVLNEALAKFDDASYYFALALIKGHTGRVVEAKSDIESGLRKMMAGEVDFFRKMESYLKVIEFYYNIRRYQECNKHAQEAVHFMPAGSRESIIVHAVSDLCCYHTGEADLLDVSLYLDRLKKTGCLYDWAALKRKEIEALCARGRVDATARIITELLEAEEIFAGTGAGMELSKTQALKSQILVEVANQRKGQTISQDSLRLFQRMSELINRHLGDDDFAEKMLDLVIPATGAERGALFLTEQGKIKLMVGRNLDKKTISDARKMSKSVIRQARKKGVMICAENALTDRRFKGSRSVILNKIHSLMCTPLVAGTKILGAVYLDSRRAFGLFGKEERDFLCAVANFVASVIEKSKAFQRTKEQNVYLRAKSFAEFAKEYLVGESEAIEEIRSAIAKVADTDSTVLITGETGCGKGIVARIIHQRSVRKIGRFVSVNCGGLPETLFESELFGFKRGAFTGAHSDKLGLFEEANKGTLFLDEISNAPLATQGKLLDAIETKKIRRLGDTSVRKVDVRLISATNQDLRKMMASGLFRPDLFYRISVITIHVPPLRERMIDLPILAEYFLEKYTYEMNKSFVGFDRRTLKVMLAYSWPGNVRELANAIERAVIFSSGRYIAPADMKLDWGFLRKNAIEHRYKRNSKQEVVEALNAAKGNVSLAARILGVTRATMYNRIKKHKIQISKKYL
jgi:transcriptional regulator with GAF, ATPase, and Fis domain/serine/threonine protein kinase/Flp pilus assembly protein TadD